MKFLNIVNTLHFANSKNISLFLLFDSAIWIYFRIELRTLNDSTFFISFFPSKIILILLLCILSIMLQLPNTDHSCNEKNKTKLSWRFLKVLIKKQMLMWDKLDWVQLLHFTEQAPLLHSAVKNGTDCKLFSADRFHSQHNHATLNFAKPFIKRALIYGGKCYGLLVPFFLPWSPVCMQRHNHANDKQQQFVLIFQMH